MFTTREIKCVMNSSRSAFLLPDLVLRALVVLGAVLGPSAQVTAYRPKGTFDPSVPTRAPEWKDHHPERVHGEHFYAFHGLHLTVQEVGTHDGEHSEHEISHRFSSRLRHPHMNKDLWKFVEEKCTPTWSHTKPSDHHFAATVHLHDRKLFCWSGYRADDVTAWQNDFDSVTYLAHIDALGSAPRAFWYTAKFDTKHHEDDALPGGSGEAGPALLEELDEPPIDSEPLPIDQEL